MENVIFKTYILFFCFLLTILHVYFQIQYSCKILCSTINANEENQNLILDSCFVRHEWETPESKKKKIGIFSLSHVPFHSVCKKRKIKIFLCFYMQISNFFLYRTSTNKRIKWEISTNSCCGVRINMKIKNIHCCKSSCPVGGRFFFLFSFSKFLIYC